MNTTTTYALAESARSKLRREVSRADYSLRLIVGHANVLDSLVFELNSAILVRESCYDNCLPTDREVVERNGRKAEGKEDAKGQQSRDRNDHYQQLPEPAHQVETTFVEIDVNSDEEEDLFMLALTRTPSRHSPF